MLDKLSDHILEMVFICVALVITIISLILYFKNKNEVKQSNNNLTLTTITQSQKIYIDIAGQVYKPGLYEASSTSRLEYVLQLAGGLTDNADKDFFAKYFNLSKILYDQEKIYIPSYWEVNNGYSIENNITPNDQDSSFTVQDDSLLIDINKAGIEELDTLPGVGKSIGQKIIDNRPYKALEQLIEKKVLSKNQFEKIKALIKM